MPVLLVIVDGAANVVTSTSTPHLDRLPHHAELRTVPPGLPVVSEVALPGLLGRELDTAPARGAVEAAAIGRRLGCDEVAWRLDLAGLETAPAEVLTRTATRLAARTGAEVHPLRRGRFLMVGEGPWEPHAAERADLERHLGTPVRIWGGGGPPDWVPLPWSTAVVSAPTGAAAGVARLLGAEHVAPAGTTGFADTDLTAKARAAEQLLDQGRHALIAVHVGAVDEAGHARDAALQVRAMAAIDGALVGPLVTLAERTGAPLVVTSDHGTDARTGRHLGGPVPASANVSLADGAAADLVAQLVSGEPVSAARRAG